MTGKMVLSTSLLIVYENIGSDPQRYGKKYKRLMKKLVLPYMTNKKQLVEAKAEGLNEDTYNRLLPQHHNLANRDDELSKLAVKTTLKIILTEDPNASLPYVYYHSSFMNRELAISLKASESREELIKYLQMLCTNAKKITICDNYFANNWDSTQSLFRSVLPRHKLSIEYVESTDIVTNKNSEKMTQVFVSSVYAEWTICASTLYENSHDRYLLIESPEGKVEVMLSSGFDHIWKANPKEITCVFREV